MRLKLNEKVYYEAVNGIPMLLNVSNGLIVGLDNEGNEFIKKVLNKDLEFDYSQLSYNLKELVTHLTNNNFIEGNFINSKKEEIAFAYLHITNRCNLNCVGCYSMNDKRNVESDLDIEHIKKSIDYLSEVNIDTVIISGGETLIRTDIGEICRYLKAKKINNVVVITNGTIVNTSILQDIKGLVDNISVSIDTYDENTEGFIRDKGIHNRIIKNIKKMKEYDFNISLLPTLHKHNYKDLQKFVDLSKKLNISISFSILTTTDEEPYSPLIFNNEDLKGLAKELYYANVPFYNAPVHQSLQATEGCGVGNDMISIGSDGSIYPCHMLMETSMKLGNIKDKNLIEAKKDINNEFFINYTVNDLEGCKNCEVKFLCGGGCRARAYMHTNDIKGKDPYCQMYYSFYMDLTNEIKKSI
ncbi:MULTISPECIES: radical SAM/SPASM domain-containing protein [Mammaliicoccus]|uniref:Radical SAM protein n=1 Tax=Mammaliicoccus sciuri TaxID=1296 RepID=A0AAW5LS15_MAMSC|nr:MULTISPECIES: radical SAM protein [Mammaliicoccus]MCD5142513.1 radical SAM protein [Mammaliicoccus sciuri]MCQ9304678.1 radical SAM protein [Mammaliicoccus sciuri]MDT0745965.1 radical SAM protein [Mammaliicoccus sciuri]MDT0753320.1 radical SAM protein [Mammaliicoccus sciuri]WQL34132.1 radical SAM protein [Mammaliicoccus sciuri]